MVDIATYIRINNRILNGKRESVVKNIPVKREFIFIIQILYPSLVSRLTKFLLTYS